MSRFKSWVGQPDQFDWITAVLRERGLLRATQWSLAGISSISALVPVTTMLSTRRPTAEVALVDTAAAVFVVAVSVFWLTRWPTRVQSEIFGVVAGTCIAGWSLTQPTAALAAVGCCAMATNSGYVALFHSNKFLVFSAALSAAVSIATGVHLAREFDIGTGLAAFWVIAMLNLSFPLAMRGMSRAMGSYAERADEDALTGLFNRRGFIAALTRRLGDPRAGDTHLTMIMIDLDAFKRINDTFGHAAGDRALIAVADVLRQHVVPTALLCRAGGEEFLIAATGPSPDAEPISAQLGAAIAELPQGLTASIGTATAELSPMGVSDVPGLIEKLIDVADSAMYTAKRRGGNQAHHL
ncbi:GGDEF domain-containing protein [Mycobacterium sp. 852002-50816_SCH5313054-b]|uniref:GGDEF domain-containing protein n=1 Tax=Mycobacterium sp. 852002-50816_SCH5313054-b TaxID=1834092 RepID=UPI000A87A794|nr:GGDEF domain-containing protein [Mycobacterium sp. 852002-50816_SCH5313054-b]